MGNDRSKETDMVIEKAESIFEFSALDLDGVEIEMNRYSLANKNYTQLKVLHQKYYQLGLRILAFPSREFLLQEYKDPAKIKKYLAKNEIKFQVFQRVRVNGPTAHPLFKYLKLMDKLRNNKKSGCSIKWNFTKFLTNRSGQLVARYGSSIQPRLIEDDIVNYLSQDT